MYWLKKNNGKTITQKSKYPIEEIVQNGHHFG